MLWSCPSTSWRRARQLRCTCASSPRGVGEQAQGPPHRPPPGEPPHVDPLDVGRFGVAGPRAGRRLPWSRCPRWRLVPGLAEPFLLPKATAAAVGVALVLSVRRAMGLPRVLSAMVAAGFVVLLAAALLADYPGQRGGGPVPALRGDLGTSGVRRCVGGRCPDAGLAHRSPRPRPGPDRGGSGRLSRGVGAAGGGGVRRADRVGAGQRQRVGDLGCRRGRVPHPLRPEGGGTGLRSWERRPPLLAVVLSGSRGGLAGLLAGLLVFVVLVWREPGARRAARLALGFVAGVLVLAALIPGMRQRILGGDPVAWATVSGRGWLWRDTMDLIAAHPFLGVGPSGFVDAIGEFHSLGWARDVGPVNPPDSPHNLILQLLTAGGSGPAARGHRRDRAVGASGPGHAAHHPAPDGGGGAGDRRRGRDHGRPLHLRGNRAAPGPVGRMGGRHPTDRSPTVTPERPPMRCSGGSRRSPWAAARWSSPWRPQPRPRSPARWLRPHAGTTPRPRPGGRPRTGCGPGIRTCGCVRVTPPPTPPPRGSWHPPPACPPPGRRPPGLPRSSEAAQDRAECLEANGDLAGATQVLAIARANDPTNVNLLLLSGVIAARSGDLQGAEELLLHASRLAPDAAAPWVNLALVYDQMRTHRRRGQRPTARRHTHPLMVRSRPGAAGWLHRSRWDGSRGAG